MKQKVGAGLSLEKFASAKVSNYDKRKVIQKQMALKAKQVNKFKRLKKRLEAEGKYPGPPPATVGQAAHGARSDAEAGEDTALHEEEQVQWQRKQQHQHQQQEQEQQHQQQQQEQQHQQAEQQHGGSLQGNGRQKHHRSKPPSQLQRLAEQAAAVKAKKEQEKQQKEQEKVERAKQLEVKKRQRSHEKHDFFRRTKRGQPVMKYRVDKILAALQKEAAAKTTARQ